MMGSPKIATQAKGAPPKPNQTVAAAQFNGTSSSGPISVSQRFPAKTSVIPAIKNEIQRQRIAEKKTPRPTEDFRLDHQRISIKTEQTAPGLLRILQAKPARQPIAPPAYRPQPALKCLQRAANRIQGAASDSSARFKFSPASVSGLRQPIGPKEKPATLVMPELRQSLAQRKTNGSQPASSLVQPRRPPMLRVTTALRPGLSKSMVASRSVQMSKAASTQSCTARLNIGQQWFDGSTGKGNGHAEMDALHKFIQTFESVKDAEAVFILCPTKVVECPSRPVCKKCSEVLSRLGFQLGTSTVWGANNMGSTEWGCSLKVRDFIKSFGIDYEEVKSL